MVSGIVRVGIFLRDGGKQKDTSLVLRGSFSIPNRNIGMVLGPVGGSRNRLFVTELKCLDASNNLVGVSAYAGWVVEGEHELVFGVDDKDGSNGEWKILVITGSGINHAISSTDGSVRISNNGELDLDFIFAMSNDVLEPFVVGLDGIDGKGGDEAVHGGKLVILESKSTNLGGTDGCYKIKLRMRETDKTKMTMSDPHVGTKRHFARKIDRSIQGLM